jgi:outer membrane protein OmpA-like peptidoglycan-associated protein
MKMDLFLPLKLLNNKTKFEIMSVFKTISISLGLTVGLFSAAKAQSQNNLGHDSQMPRWFVGAGLSAGTQIGSIEQGNWIQSYPNALNSNISDLKQSGASHLGFNFSLGYFFGKKRNFGLGTGLQFLSTKTNYSIEKFAIEYQSTDNFGSVFRQGLRANNDIEEQIKQSLFGLPVMVMYKKQLNEKWGLNLDAGVIFNLSQKATFNADKASFDYEAIYSFDANGNPVYDNSSTPNPNDWLITKAHYEKVNSDGNANAYFEDLNSKGYNVGLGVKPNTTSGDVNNTNMSISWFIRPSVSYRIKPNLAIHANFVYQQLKTSFDENANYRVTDKRGQYSSMSNGLKSNAQGLLQFGVGIRYYFGKEHVEKVKEEPKPVVKEEPKKEDPYKEMVKVTIKLQDEKYAKPVSGSIVIKQKNKEVFNGNADASGLSNFYLEPGSYSVSVSAKGYIPAEEVLELKGSEKGTSKIIELKQPKIEKGLVFKLKAINFETGADKMKESSFDILNKMATILNENPNMVIEVAGHTDNVGDDQKNLILSENRAKTVMNYLLTKGVKASQMKAIGYGETQPIADNNTEDGRLANRRVMFTVLEF